MIGEQSVALIYVAKVSNGLSGNHNRANITMFTKAAGVYDVQLGSKGIITIKVEPHMNVELSELVVVADGVQASILVSKDIKILFAASEDEFLARKKRMCQHYQLNLNSQTTNCPP
ncbi:hypothetical protein CsatB_023692 [Cannabis sativa]